MLAASSLSKLLQRLCSPETHTSFLASVQVATLTSTLYRINLDCLSLAPTGAHLERYPTRIFLCAYMVQSHPQTVFNHQGELEDALTAAGSNMLGSFEALLARLAGPVNTPR